MFNSSERLTSLEQVSVALKESVIANAESIGSIYDVVKVLLKEVEELKKKDNLLFEAIKALHEEIVTITEVVKPN